MRRNKHIFGQRKMGKKLDKQSLIVTNDEMVSKKEKAYFEKPLSDKQR